MSAELDTIQPIDDDLIPPTAQQSLEEIKTEILVRPEETDQTGHVEWIPPEEDIAELTSALELFASAIDYPESDDENARGAMEAERDALQARVTELENDLKNARRDIAYLNAKLDEALKRAQEAK